MHVHSVTSQKFLLTNYKHSNHDRNCLFNLFNDLTLQYVSTEHQSFCMNPKLIEACRHNWRLLMESQLAFLIQQESKDSDEHFLSVFELMEISYNTTLCEICVMFSMASQNSLTNNLFRTHNDRQNINNSISNFNF